MNPPKPPLAPRALLSLGLLCFTAGASAGPHDPPDAAGSARLRAAYLECDRITAGSRVAPDVMAACQQVGDALRDREFGGSFERLLAWWREHRQRTAAQAAPGMAPAAAKE